MDVLDALIGLAVLSAAATGYRLGLIANVAGWVGLAAGVGLAVWWGPAIARGLVGDDPVMSVAVTLAVFLVLPPLLASIGQAVGLRVRAVVARGPVGFVDRGVGTVAGGFSVLALVWLLAPVGADLPVVAAHVRGSAIVGAVTRLAPPPPDPMKVLRRTVSGRFPEVFADLRPAPDTGPPPGTVPIAAAVVERATASSVRVEALACGRISTGSGFIAAPETVLTNAHVVAGASTVEVRRTNGTTLTGTVVVFDDDRDVAVIDVPGLGGSPLPIVDTDPPSPAAVIGYPMGTTRPRVQAAQVDSEQQVLGRDIYGRDLVRRRVQFLAARLQHGDSGAPVVDGEGRVVGQVFAVAADRASTAYALDAGEVLAALEAPRNAAVGPCM